MSGYYTAITYLSWLSLGILCLLVYENARLEAKNKRLLYLTYALIAVSALTEYCGVLFGGKESIPRGIVVVVKTADYILTPIAGSAFIFQLRLRNRWKSFLVGLLAVNTLLQLISTIGGWMVIVDEHNHYTHGPLYPLYLGVCVTVVVVVALQFILYGRAFQQQNRRSLFAIMILVLVGIFMQELSDGSIWTSYLAMTVAASMLFIHNVEFASQEMDDDLKRTQMQLDMDTLTHVCSRHAYSRALNDLEKEKTLPDGLAVFSIDINGLKQVNDQLGHEAGDELICGAAECVSTVFGADGQCFRTGGDEFVVLTRMNREEAGSALERLKQEADRWQGKTQQPLSLAAGFALAEDHKELSVEKLVGEADKAMYEAKSAHYRSAGFDRRKRR